MCVWEGGGGYEYVSYALGGSGGMLPPPPPPPQNFFLCSETVSGKNYDYRYRASIQVLGIAPNFRGLIIFVIFVKVYILPCLVCSVKIMAFHGNFDHRKFGAIQYKQMPTDCSTVDAGI